MQIGRVWAGVVAVLTVAGLVATVVLFAEDSTTLAWAIGHLRVGWDEAGKRTVSVRTAALVVAGVALATAFCSGLLAKARGRVPIYGPSRRREFASLKSKHYREEIRTLLRLWKEAEASLAKGQAAEPGRDLKLMLDLCEDFANGSIAVANATQKEMVEAHRAIQEAYLSRKGTTEEQFKGSFGNGLFGEELPKQGYVLRIMYWSGVLFGIANSLSRTMVSSTTIPLAIAHGLQQRPVPALEEIIRDWAEKVYPNESEAAFEEIMEVFRFDEIDEEARGGPKPAEPARPPEKL